MNDSNNEDDYFLPSTITSTNKAFPRTTMTGDEYLFKDLPLTPAICETLILELFAGELIERHRIVEDVLRAHSERGGRPSTAQNSTGPVRNALSTLYNKGLAQNPSKGYWRIAAGKGEERESPNGFCDPNIDRIDSDELDTCSGAIASEHFRTGAVYLYYLPTYKEIATLRNEESWACKIGRTDRDPVDRVLTQAATALPERPVIAVVHRTDQPLEWERALHSALTIRGLRIKDSPGSEWFVTSPEAVLELIRVIDPTSRERLNQNLL